MSGDDQEAPRGRPLGADGPSRELVMIVAADARIRAVDQRLTTQADAPVDDVQQLLERVGATARPLFSRSEDELQAAAAEPGVAGLEVPDLSVFYRVEAPAERLDEIADRLLEHDVVEAAYVKPGAELPVWIDEAAVPSSEDPPDQTPDFTDRQGYLDAAPGGIGTEAAWGEAGGRGFDVQVIDIEGAWRWTHEDLQDNQGGTVSGIESTHRNVRNHGTNVVGVIGADLNSFGVTGIAADAFQRTISVIGTGGSSRAIEEAADLLRPGDIALIELHRPGPRFNFEQRDDQRGYLPVEWWEDDFQAIRYAVARGVIVVEAGGNGAEDLDDELYEDRPDHFPSSWTNPLRRTNRDSGAILVGAGAPPPGTHDRDHGPDRSRLAFSNWGRLVDAQGWGREVTTTGGSRFQAGDLQGGSDEDRWYTDRFGGTSSASPIVVGAIACVQGILRRRGHTPLTPARARRLLRTSGSPQQDAEERPRSQRIGTRPDLCQLVARVSDLVGTATGRVEQLRVHREIGYGPPHDHMPVHVVVELDSRPAERYGFPLSPGDDQQTHAGWVDALRTAVRDGRRVAIEYQYTCSRNQVVRHLELLA